MNPRYIVYARAHGKSPEEMKAHDEEAWPGGRMAGYMLWISENLTAFLCERPTIKRHMMWEDEQSAFTAWLETKYP